MRAPRGRARRTLRAICVAALTAACAHAPRPAPPPVESAPPPVTETPPPAPRAPAPFAEGIASWYGPGFAGRPTANGERFNPEALTAAHRTLPFETCVVVENVANGRRARVRVNDRGPYAKGRLIDVSAAAARALGMRAQGVARVRLYHC